jgi:hypothetical protein
MTKKDFLLKLLKQCKGKLISDGVLDLVKGLDWYKKLFYLGYLMN